MVSENSEHTPGRVGGRDDPESPFLGGGLSSGEAVTSRGGLQVDSPFQNAFEADRSEPTGSGIGEMEMFVPEAYEEAYVEGDTVLEPRANEEPYWKGEEALEGPYRGEGLLTPESGGLWDRAEQERPEVGFEAEWVSTPSYVSEAFVDELESFDEPEVEEREAEAFEGPPVAFEQQTAGITRVTFPSGESLSVVSGPTAEGQEHYDPNNTGNPLLDTSGAHRSKRLSRNFTVDELASSGGRRFDKARIAPRLVECLQAIRDRVGKPVTITSGYRPYAYNVDIYSKRNQKPTKSRHSSGQAADIKVAGATGLQLAKIAIDACGCDIGVGIGDNYAHIDTRGRWASWTYLRDARASSRALQEINAYRRSRCPDRGTAPVTPPASSTINVQPQSLTTTSELRRRIIDIANREWVRWGYGKKKETDREMRDVLRSYWATVLRSPQQIEKWIDDQQPWSAAFISWVMQQAGSGQAFSYATMHYVYIAAAKQSRLRADASKFWAYNITEIKPEVGDLVCRERSNSGATYANVDDGTARSTHSDIVTEVSTDRITVIGGNVSNSVGSRKVLLDNKGLVIPDQKGGGRFFAIIKVR